MSHPGLERMARIHLLALEHYVAGVRLNGQVPDAGAVWVIEYDMLRAPQTAAGCPVLLGLVHAEVAATVKRLAGGVPGTPPAAAPAPVAVSRLSVRAAAGRLAITPRAVRAACARGSLAATRHRVTGEWQIDAAAVAEYGRTHAKITR